jgi:hypothetical protein
MMQHVLIILTKRKKWSPNANHSDTVAQAHSRIVSNDLAHVSVPAEDGWKQVPHEPMVLSYPLHPHHGLFTNIPFMGHWYIRTHSCSSKVSKQFFININHDYKVVIHPYSYHHNVMKLIILRLNLANKHHPFLRVSRRLESIVNLAREII